MDGLINGWMNGWMDGWMDKQICGWMWKIHSPIYREKQVRNDKGQK